ncbi:MAG: DEAD/DEAH box helicase [Lysobacterales bacterium]
MTDEVPATFAELGLPSALLDTLTSVGYESPSPIQAATIPPLLAGRDVLGQAQTGTGKTAAFALPILAKLDMSRAKPQALVLAPTRELAIQVSEAFQRYAQKLPDFRVLPIYGGQGYGAQLHGLARGTHVVVGTPGRIKDHLARGTLDLSELRVAVLDEADEMLRMGFIDDVEHILQHTPATRQIALFSATMPSVIRRIAQTHLKDPTEVTIRSSTTTAAAIRQRYWLVSGVNKLDALTRILEAEPFEAMIVFARTKQGTEELAERLSARGFAAAAINGDLQQSQREKTIARLKEGQLDILVATDVAARGLDVERISHVLNYDIPYDSEAYVHRIGRTGRAGRSGDAILFVTPRERHLLRAIERSTRQPIDPMLLPSVQAVNEKRIARFQARISEAMEATDLDVFRRIIEEYVHQNEVSELDVAAALARMVQGKTPLLLPPSGDTTLPGEAPLAEARGPAPRSPREYERPARAGASSYKGVDAERPPRESRPPRPERSRPEAPARAESGERAPAERAATPERAPSVRERSAEAPSSERSAERVRPAKVRAERAERPQDAPDLELYRVEVGSTHGLKPGNLVGAIANEAGLESRYMGRISIEDEHSTIELPAGMPKEIFQHLKKVWVSGRMLRISKVDPPTGGPTKRPRADAGKPRKPRS